jgi:uncharacterized protein (TIGR02145 family)
VQYQNGASNTNSPNPIFTSHVKGICPNGWHLPTDAEWSTLEYFLGGSSLAGGLLKSTTNLWIYPNSGALNTSGFSALPGGNRNYFDGSFERIGEYSYFWSSSELTNSDAIFRFLFKNDSFIYRNNGSEKNQGFSVRCLKD